MKKGCFFLLIAFNLLLQAFGQNPLFQPVPSTQTGITFANNINETEQLNVLSYEYFYNGAGVAVGDINNDGLPDLFFSANQGANKLYLNQGDFKFKDITADACREMAGRKGAWKTGVTMADVNGDGLLDIYVCYSGRGDDDLRRNQLFINQGNLHFTEAAKQYGLDDKSYSTQAAFFDYDKDGDLDMFLLNHSVKKIDNMELARYRNQVDSLAGDKLYENRNGHFVDVSAKAGLHQNPLTFGLGMSVADVNGDGWQDIYVSNDYNEPDYLYINNRNGSFTDATETALRHIPQFSMGVDVADFNNDTLPDIMSLDMLPEDNKRQKLLQLQENYEMFQLMRSQDLHQQYMRNMLQVNNGDGTFSEIGQLAGVSNTDWSWSPLFADFDNDGWKDLFISNGYLRDYTNKDFLKYWGDYKVKKAIDREPVKLMDLVMAMPSTSLYNYIFKNNGHLQFSNMRKEWGMTDLGISSGAAYADLDNDGDLDLVINRINQEAAVYRNNSREQQHSHYLNIQLEFVKPNRYAVGAKVFLYKGHSVQLQERVGARGYLSCMDNRLHFGLGSDAIIDSVRIVWPNTRVQMLHNPLGDRLMTITYNPTACEEPAPIAPATGTVFNAPFEPIDYRNECSDQNDFKRQPLMLFMYSKTGPVLAGADVDGDGREDLYISGDKAKPGKLYRQQPDGRFLPAGSLDENKDELAPVSAAVFADVDGDGDPDLYVARGGYGTFQPHTPALQDELYINDGKGRLGIIRDLLPDLSGSAKSCVRPCDFDGDGDIDFFVGGRVIPGKYPVAPRSYLLSNNGKGKFEIVPTSFDSLGMVTDASWMDVNEDGRPDLILCGEFMPVILFLNTAQGFVDKTRDYFGEPSPGIWFSLTQADLNNDGKPDLIAGNLGENSQLHFNQKEPAELWYADFDGNGSIDPFLNFYIDGKSYPYVSRDELNDQIYGMRRKFSSYKDYANAQMNQLFDAEALAKAGKLTASESRSVVFINTGKGFKKQALPVEAQFSVVMKTMVLDYNHDGNRDLLLLGNRSDNRLKIGSIDANYGTLLQGDGKGHFTYIPQKKSGLCLMGDVRSADTIDVGKQPYLVLGICDGPVCFIKKP